MTIPKIEEVTGVGKSTFYRWRDGDWTKDPRGSEVRDFCVGLGIPLDTAFAALGWVEDDPTTCDLLKAIFAHMGWEVEVASTVVDGLRLLDPPPELLLLDLSLSDGDGAAILRQVRSARLPTRVAVTTGHDPAGLGPVSELGPDAVFWKPIDVGEVCRSFGLRP